MAAQTSLFSTYPVKHNEGQTHDHEDETQSGETSSLDLGPGACWLQVFRNDSDVEESRKDEDQSGSSGCPCNTKNVSNVGNKDDQQVHDEQQAHCDGDVTQPVEGFLREQQLQERSTNREQDHGHSQRDGHQNCQSHT